MSYTQEELKTAFETVEDKENWKNPIDSRIPIDQIDVVGDAIIHFTGSIPDFYDDRNGTIRVEAEGYYMAIDA